MTPAEVLRKAARLIDLDGWCQIAANPDSQQRCAMVAILDAAKDEHSLALSARYDLHAWAVRALRDRIGGRVVAWNDRPDQTAGNVIATMRRVADDLDAQVLA